MNAFSTALQKYLTYFFMVLLSVCFVIISAMKPALTNKEFPSQAIVQFSKPLITNPEDKNPKHLKMVTYNIGYASGVKNNLPVALTKDEVIHNLDEMVKTLKSLNADIIAMQEVDFHSARTFDINQMEYLAKGLNMPYGAYVVTWSKKYLPWPYWPPQIQFGHMVSGQAILSRYPILNQDLHTFHKPKSNAFWYNWFYLDRILQKTKIQIGEQEIAVWNVHLEAFAKDAREEQAQFLANQVKAETNPHKWVLGDFNSTSFVRPNLPPEKQKEVEDNGEALKIFKTVSGLKDAETSEPFYTMPSWDAFKKIDHIFYNDAKLEQVGTVKSLASDHLPVVAEFTR